MVDEKVSEPVCAQPGREPVGMGIVFARMTDKKCRHCPSVSKKIKVYINVLANRKTRSLTTSDSHFDGLLWWL